MNKILLAVMPAFVLLVSGCVYTGTQTVGGGLVLSLQPDPPQIFTDGLVGIKIDLDNRNTRKIANVSYSIFDPGVLETVGTERSFCQKRIPEMKSNEFQTFTCYMRLNRDIVSKDTSTTVSARAEYRTEFNTVQLVELMTEPEYQRRQATGDFVQKPAVYSYRDDNIDMGVEFSESLPLIVRPGKEYYMRIKIRNAGNGFVKRITWDDFLVSPIKRDNPVIYNCPFINDRSWYMDVVGDEFPTVTCRIVMPGGFSAIENYGLLITLLYSYEVRESATVRIVR